MIDIKMNYYELTRGWRSPRGLILRTEREMGRKSSPWHLTEMGMENFLPYGDGDGEALPDREFLINI